MSDSNSALNFDVEMDIDAELQSIEPVELIIPNTQDTNTNILSTYGLNLKLNLLCTMGRTTAALTSCLALPGVDIVIYKSFDEY
ncbi:unnamed protein product [Rotaria magnacalcarata]|uniref:Uncharacterized protein n=2 Tax=Rotaria magnacalcarata TaxID=392030 RepID=A0A8S3J920_9BILA|nr:unnamed protein product [Rotaria magnacalcarata]